jgi:hypothetical protein
LTAVLATAGAAHSQAIGLRQERATGTRPALLAILEQKGHPLVRVDPVTLRRSGRSLPVGAYTSVWAFSPDHSQVALGNWRGRPRVRFVALGPMRSRGEVQLADRGEVDLLTWATPSRLLALVQEGSSAVAPQVVTVDARAHRVLGSTPLPGWILRTEPSADGLVALSVSDDQIAPVQLAVADATGAVRTVRLEQIAGGFVSSAPGSGSDVRQAELPGLAVDPAGERAYVVGADQLVAEVDLQTLAVTYHDLQQPRSLFARATSLRPLATAKGSAGHIERALWLGNGTLALAGEDDSETTSIDTRGNTVIHWATVPTGLKIVDTRSWSVRTIDPNVSEFSFAGGSLLGTGTLLPPDAARATGTGLVAYDLAGRKLFHRFGTDYDLFTRTAGSYLYVYRNEHGADHVLVLKLPSGRLVRDLRARMPTFVD